ncbi:outer membrane beta-barrel protein [Phenylobacterium sp. CCH12-B4]|uniref:outer membrane beta-barrel protein n=2 Tax=unclassified Phenylobacterium TaxID=2640670 RepID=UPI00083B170D|nr:outer membrane beta-barrel protein [Phenylobacterium sp. CCH12-B4]
MKSLFAGPIVLAAVAGVAGVAEAQVASPGLYGSVGYNRKSDSDLSTVQLRLGGRFGSYFGVEGEAGLGVDPDTATFPSVPALQVKNQLRREFAAYAVGYYPVGPNLDVFARVGYGTTDFKRTLAQAPNVSVVKFGAESVNYGIGGQYFLDGKNGVRIDYTRQDFNKGLKTDDTWSVAYTRRF